MLRIDQNRDGVIDYYEFMGVMQTEQGYNIKMAERANNKLALLKEHMTTYLTSHGDAYRKFDSSRVQKMCFMDFNTLVTEMFQAASQQVPAFYVIKDLFDAVDIKKDGFIDLKEWNQTFNNLSGGGTQTSQLPTNLSHWENSEEHNKIGAILAKHRKALMDKFLKQSTSDDKRLVTFAQAKKAMYEMLCNELGTNRGMNDKKLKVSDGKLKFVLSAG